MWLMIARFLLLIVTPEQTSPARSAAYNKGRWSYIARWPLLIPHWLNLRAHDLYLAFLVFLGRYYLLPALADYQIYRPADLPPEARLASLLKVLISWL